MLFRRWFVLQTALSATLLAGCLDRPDTSMFSEEVSDTEGVDTVDTFGPADTFEPTDTETPASVPGAPTIGTATRGNAQASVTFTAPASNGGSAITGYTITSSSGGFTATGATSPLVVAGLTNGTAYTFTVTATNAVGTSTASAASNSVTPASVPDAPTIGTATRGNAQASVTFTAPASDGGSGITGYTATSSPGGITGTCTASPCTVSTLTNGIAYIFTMTATNTVGISVSSAASNSVTPATVPGAPTIGTATRGNAQASVTFTAPAITGGSAITGYTITSSSGGFTATSVASPLVITGLTNGTAYSFTVTATNDVGTSAPSAASNSVTPTLPPPPAGYSLIPAGSFTMGSPTGEIGRDTDETQHIVTLTRAFYMKTTEVTQGEWKALAGGTNPACFQSTTGTSCTTSNANDNGPVEWVDWFSVIAFTNALSVSQGLAECYTLTGCADPTNGWHDGEHADCTGATFVGLDCTGYRLPTESEWEYAARAETTTATYAGNLSGTITGCTTLQAALDGIAWWCRNSGNRTNLVAQMTANAWGLYDMLGNVWEWTWTWYETYPGAETDPIGPATGDFRVSRGGGWYFDPRYVRAAYRGGSGPTSRNDVVGFRPSRSVVP